MKSQTVVNRLNFLCGTDSSCEADSSSASEEFTPVLRISKFYYYIQSVRHLTAS
jgi:hypothetical protein